MQPCRGDLPEADVKSHCFGLWTLEDRAGIEVAENNGGEEVYHEYKMLEFHLGANRPSKAIM